jgi:hypothetical protein
LNISTSSRSNHKKKHKKKHEKKAMVTKVAEAEEGGSAPAKKRIKIDLTQN